ncbi:MAG: hypothetical protein HY746_05600 [Elusimicrobia bacterium]|nr:hypothetical protein [Elusimicrobiota bacterium]
MTKLVLPFFFVYNLFLYSSEHKDANSVFSVDFPAGWTFAKSNDPDVVLKMERGKSIFEFAKLDSELSEYYLKMRVKEQIDSLRTKGTSISGDVKSASIHGVSNVYYASYDSMGVSIYVGFFTYSEASFAISVQNMSDSEFKSIVFTIRKPGEIIKIAKPKPPPKPKIVKKEPKELPLEEYQSPATATETVAGILTSTGALVSSTVSIEEAGMQKTAEILSGIKTFPERETPEQKIIAKLPPYIPRNPLPFWIWAVIAVVWFAGSFAARSMVAGIQNPKIAPPPQDVPPDFFFPFIVTRIVSSKDINYYVLTRQRQNLVANYNDDYRIHFVIFFYGLLFLHVLWSLFEFFGTPGGFTNLLLQFPLGRIWASAPEVLFLVPFLIGTVNFINKEQVLKLYDSQRNLMLEARKHPSYCLLKDGKGKDVARLSGRGSIFGMEWDFFDVDGQIIFTIKDEYPKVCFLRKIFGHLGGVLRRRYGIFVQDRRAGFVFLDPSSSDRFQVHLEFNYARLAHPAQILMSILYILSKERDPAYPSPF